MINERYPIIYNSPDDQYPSHTSYIHILYRCIYCKYLPDTVCVCTVKLQVTFEKSEIRVFGESWADRIPGSSLFIRHFSMQSTQKIKTVWLSPIQQTLFCDGVMIITSIRQRIHAIYIYKRKNQPSLHRAT